MRLTNILGAAVACVLLLPINEASAGRRIALVIGNDAYQELPVLKKAVADAESFARVLSEKGFDEVMLKRNLSRSEIDIAIAAFLDGILPGDTAVFVYSGHGWSDGSQNYLVGTDAPETGAETLLSRISVPLQNGVNGVVDEMARRGALLKVAIIDACRDNPFLSTTPGRSVGLGRGLSRVEPPSGTFVVFSAGAGQSALDRLSDNDPDANGLFTRIFLPLIRADMPLLDAVKQTQERVFGAARTINHDQRPAYYDEVLGSACLSSDCRPTNRAPTVIEPSEDHELVFWKSVENSTRAADLQAYIEQFPHGIFVKLARLRIDEIAADAPAVADAPPDLDAEAVARIDPADVEPVTAAAETRQAQAALYELNFDPGPADGKLGRRTVEAIRAFQTETRLAADGVLTRGMLKRILAEPERKPWGAIVYSEMEGNFGMAWGKDSRSAAVAAAQDSCGLNGRCGTQLTFFTEWCGAFAHGDRGWAMLSGRSLDETRSDTLRTCRVKDEECEVIVAVCANGSGKFVSASQ